jgi:ribosomal protein S6
MSGTKMYEMMILLNEEFNDNELKTWAFNFAKGLQSLSASEISVISRGKRNLAYSLKTHKKGNFIQINLLSLPKNIDNFTNILKLDTNVLRFLILNKTI